MKRRRFVAVTVGALVLGGVLMVGYGSGVSPAAAAKPPKMNPLDQILAKLDEILTAIGGIGGGGGGQDGNHTLRWDQNLPAAQRFVVLAAFANAAVLDKNTGLVWEKSPAATTTHTWSDAVWQCVNKSVGGTLGWRLPSVVELRSVQDPTLPAPFVPASVFTGVQSFFYWSATTTAEDPANAWRVLGVVFPSNKALSLQVWCVRGPMNADQY